MVRRRRWGIITSYCFDNGGGRGMVTIVFE